MNLSCSYSHNVWPALITLVLIVYLGVYSWRRRIIPAARPFTIACIFGSLWTLGVILEISALHYAEQIFWKKFQAIWQLPSATAITCFVLQYAGLGRWLTHRNYVLLFLLPLLCGLLMVTNDFHYLIWTGFRMNGHVIGSPGSLFWTFIGYGILLGLFNVSVLVWWAISSSAHRWPVIIMVLGQVIGRTGYTLDKLDADLMGPGESVLIILGVTTAAYAVAFLGFHTIDPVTAARKAVLQQMNEGLFVIDLAGRILDLNPMAGAILGIPEDNLRGMLLTEVLTIDGELLKRLGKPETAPTEITLGKGKSSRHYNPNLTTLTGRHGEDIGQLLLLRDVTEEKKAQTKILEQQNAAATLQERDRLAHEIHDGIGQVLGYVSMQAQTALKWVRDDNKDKAESLLGRIVEVSRDAHADVRESILSLRTGSDPDWTLIPALKEYIDKFQKNFGIRTELSVPDEIGDNTFDPGAGVQLLRVIQEAMTNCRKHSGAHFLKVTVVLDGDRAFITISDDGKGFNPGQLEKEGNGHFGLAFMRERMAQVGGSLMIDSIPRGGTILKLEVPISKQQGESQ